MDKYFLICSLLDRRLYSSSRGCSLWHAGLPQVGTAALTVPIYTVAHGWFRYSTNVLEVLYEVLRRPQHQQGSALIMGPRHPEILADPTPLLLR